MKKLLTILLVVLGMTTVNAQGWLGYTNEDIKTELVAEEWGLDLEEDLKAGVNEAGHDYLIIYTENYDWICIFNEGGLVAESHLVSGSWNAFLNQASYLDDKFAKTGEGHWINAFSTGAVNIESKKYDYSDFPVFIYIYLSY